MSDVYDVMFAVISKHSSSLSFTLHTGEFIIFMIFTLLEKI